MTDLKKGIIEINGVEISSKTTPLDILTKLESKYSFHNASSSGKSDSFCFHSINICGRYFTVTLYFYLRNIDSISLRAKDDIGISCEEKFKADCEWLKSILGEPDEVNADGNSYFFDGFHIYSFIQRDLSRNPAETFIVCKYDK